MLGVQRTMYMAASQSRASAHPPQSTSKPRPDLQPNRKLYPFLMSMAAPGVNPYCSHTWVTLTGLNISDTSVLPNLLSYSAPSWHSSHPHLRLRCNSRRSQCRNVNVFCSSCPVLHRESASASSMPAFALESGTSCQSLLPAHPLAVLCFRR